MMESRDVEFIENKFNKDFIDALILTQTQQGDFNLNTTLGGTKRIESGSPSEQRKSQRIGKLKEFMWMICSYLVQI